jgi:DNA-binding GntR family transcriptional regulator
MRLGPTESDLLVRLSSAAGIRVLAMLASLSTLSPADVRACKRLAALGCVDLEPNGKFRVSETGIERSKQIY